MEEIMRVLVGLQTVDKYSVALPADWQPGDDIIVSAANTFKQASERMDGDGKEEKCYDWFFCTREIPCDEIHKKMGK